MPVWPILMIITAGLTLWGWRHNAWEVPAIAFCGYIAMRALVAYTPAAFLEVAGCALWLFFAAIMVYRGGAIPGFFYALSALTYPILLIFGFSIEYMGLAPIIADVFAACALLSIGGGIYGVANSNLDRSGFLDRVQGYTVGMASREKTDHRGL